MMWENHFPAVNHGFRFGSDDQYHQTRSASSRPDFLTAASVMEALNRAHLDSMCPQDEGKASLEVGVKDLTGRILCQMFPVHPHNYSTHYQMTISWQLCSSLQQVSKTYGRRPDDSTTKSISELWSKLVWNQVHLWTIMFANPCWAQNSNNRTPPGCISGRCSCQSLPSRSLCCHQHGR